VAVVETSLFEGPPDVTIGTRSGTSRPTRVEKRVKEQVILRIRFLKSVAFVHEML
jgi:hypothetical protein